MQIKKMEIKALSIETLSNVMFQHTIKLMSYDDSNIVIVTKYDEIFYLKQKDDPIDNNDNIKEYSFEKIDFSSSFKITHLACRNDTIILINENNELFLKGYFTPYNEKNIELIDRMESLKFKKIKYLRLGLNFLFILTNDNALYGFGDNCSALGIIEEDDGDSEKTFNEMAITNETDDWIEISFKVKDISCSDSHSILLDLNGDIYTTGNNDYGKLGLGDEEDKTTFTKVNLNFKVIKIFADYETSFILNEYNELFGCGYNETGQLGIGTSIGNTTVFTKINFFNCRTKNFYFSNSNSTFITDENNNIYVSGEDKMIMKYLNLKTLNTFEKLNIFDCKRKYIYLAIMFNRVVFFSSDYKINDYEEENKLGLKCFSKILQNKLIDINIYCKDIILKKRKRIY